MQEARDPTCQICGRVIKAKGGLIAHHGYTRPYEGWQTSSCEGARYLPYEVSCDRLAEVIEYETAFWARQEQELKVFIANPPETLVVITKRTYGPDVEKTYTKPEDFNPDEYCTSRTYAGVYKAEKYNREHTVKMIKANLECMRQRLADWQREHAPAEKPDAVCSVPMNKTAQKHIGIFFLVLARIATDAYDLTLSKKLERMEDININAIIEFEMLYGDLFEMVDFEQKRFMK